MIFNRSAENPFRPMTGASNAHLQTILQRLTLPDGDFVDLAWSENPARARNKPRRVLFHGLLQVCKTRGWPGVVMHFRGCSGVPNRLNRINHSGETDDASYFLQWLHTTWGAAPTAAFGISLGGNMLACLMGKQGNDCLLDAGVTVSAPLMLEPCSQRLERGLSRLYQRYLLNLLKKNARRKLHAWPGTLPVNLVQLESIRQPRDFDNAITARAHGFIDASDYYRRCSAMLLLPGVRKPLLIVHAQDDPFMAPEVIPDSALLPPNVEYQLTQHGGHVGFVGGTLRSPQMWLEQRIP